MKKTFMTMVILIISVSLVGCFTPAEDVNKDGEQVVQVPDEQNPTEQNPPEQGPVEQDDNGQIAEGNEIKIDKLKEKLHMGMTQQEVQVILGDQFTAVTGAMDNSRMWRFDRGMVDGYTSPESEYDMGDIDGLLRGDLAMQIFVNWSDNDVVNGYSAIYFNEADGRVYNYHIFEDGFEKEQAITN